MLRTTGLVSAWMAAVLASALAWAQEPASDHKTPHATLPKSLERIRSEVRAAVPRSDAAVERTNELRQRTADRLRAPAPTRATKSAPGSAAALAELGASAPFDYSAQNRYLVAAVRGGVGLALWDAASGRRLKQLESSNRSYSLVAIADDARWIAAVRRDDDQQIDLWQASNCRHVRVIQAPSGPKTRLEFAANNQLRVVSANGDAVVYSIPAGVAVGGSQSRREGAAVARPPVRGESLKEAKPAAPSTSRVAPRAQPPVVLPPPVVVRPRVAEREAPLPVRPAPSFAAPAAPRMAAPVAPRMAAPPPRAARSEALEAAPPQPTISAPAIVSPTLAPPSASPVEPTFEPASPAFDEPATAAPERMESAAPDEAEASEPASPALDGPTLAVPGERGHSASERSPAPHADPLHAASEAAESAAESGAAPSETPRSFRYELRAEPPAEPAPAAAGAAPPAPAASSSTESSPMESPPAVSSPAPAEAPGVTSVNIHYATNRNRLTPKDREWMVYFRHFFTTLPAYVVYALVILSLLVFPWFGKRSWAASAVLAGVIALCALGSLEAYVRSQLRDEMSGELYGCRATDLAYGTCEISVPPPQNRRPGEVSRPVSVWVFEAPENPEKHFMLRHFEEHADKAAFYRSLSSQLEKSNDRAALLFIHGYNVSFEDAIFRTAQLAVDLKFPGAPVAFCWPSYADPVKYPFDEQQAEVSIPALREVLDDLAARSGAKRVHIIAHSMGNRVLAGALRSMDAATQARNKEVFRELVLAAPDIDSRVFRTQVLPHIERTVQHCTLYASSRDRALLMSRYFHNYQRLGETQPELLIASGLDTIDASMVDTSLLGHSYIGDVQSIVSDLHDLVVGGKRAFERLGLELFEHDALRYWSIRPRLQTASDGSPRR